MYIQLCVYDWQRRRVAHVGAQLAGPAAHAVADAHLFLFMLFVVFA